METELFEQQNLSTQAVLPEEHLQKWHHIREIGILGNEIVYVMNSLALSDEQDVCGFIVKTVQQSLFLTNLEGNLRVGCLQSHQIFTFNSFGRNFGMAKRTLSAWF